MQVEKILIGLLACCGVLASSGCSSNNLLSDTPEGKDGPFTAADRAYVFVSSQTTVGNMTGLTAGGCSGGGVAQADCACTALAKSANLLRRRDSRFAAWLSTSTDDARCRLLGVNGNTCSTAGGEIWHLPTGFPVADNLFALTDTLSTPLQIGIVRTESGAVPTATDAWTGTNNAGQLNSPTTNCLDWGDGTGTSNARVGTIASTGTSWTNGPTGPCSTQLPVYCFALP